MPHAADVQRDGRIRPGVRAAMAFLEAIFAERKSVDTSELHALARRAGLLESHLHAARKLLGVPLHRVGPGAVWGEAPPRDPKKLSHSQQIAARLQARPLSTRVLVLDADGRELAERQGLEQALSVGRGLAESVVVVGVRPGGAVVALAGLHAGAYGEAPCKKALAAWKEAHAPPAPPAPTQVEAAPPAPKEAEAPPTPPTSETRLAPPAAAKKRERKPASEAPGAPAQASTTRPTRTRPTRTRPSEERCAEFRKTLGDRDLLVFDQRLAVDEPRMTLRELGDLLGVRRERVWQIEQRLAGRLRGDAAAPRTPRVRKPRATSVVAKAKPAPKPKPAPRPPRELPRDRAVAFLREVLATRTLSGSELFGLAAARGISRTTLNRVRGELRGELRVVSRGRLSTWSLATHHEADAMSGAILSPPLQAERPAATLRAPQEEPTPRAPPDPGAVDALVALVRETLAARGGRVPSAELCRIAREAGHSRRRIETARTRLRGVVLIGGGFWILRGPGAEAPEQPSCKRAAEIVRRALLERGPTSGAELRALVVQAGLRPRALKYAAIVLRPEIEIAQHKHRSVWSLRGAAAATTGPSAGSEAAA